MYCVVFLIAKEVTFGSKIEAGFSFNNGPIKRLYKGDFCYTVSEVNVTCPLRPGRLHLASISSVYITTQLYVSKVYAIQCSSYTV